MLYYFFIIVFFFIIFEGDIVIKVGFDFLVFDEIFICLFNIDEVGISFWGDLLIVIGIMVILVGVFDVGEMGILFLWILIYFVGVEGIIYCFFGERIFCGEMVIVFVGVCDFWGKRFIVFDEDILKFCFDCSWNCFNWFICIGMIWGWLLLGFLVIMILWIIGGVVDESCFFNDCVVVILLELEIVFVKFLIFFEVVLKLFDVRVIVGRVLLLDCIEFLSKVVIFWLLLIIFEFRLLILFNIFVLLYFNDIGILVKLVLVLEFFKLLLEVIDIVLYLFCKIILMLFLFLMFVKNKYKNLIIFLIVYIKFILII